MARNSKVALGLPVYNGEKYLEDAIEAILAQSYGDFCLMICDNHSTDGSEEISRRFAATDDRITYHRHDKNIGAAPNFNFAFNRSDAPYFKWAACDDLMEPNYLEQTVPLLDAHPEAAIAHGRSLDIDQHGEVQGDFDRHVCLSGDRPSQRFHAILWASYFTEVFGLMRSDMLARTGLHGSHPGSDRNFMAELLLYGDVVYSDAVVFRRRAHPDSYVQFKNNKMRQFFMDPAATLARAPFFYRVQHYRRAISTAPISAGERMACRAALAGWSANRIREAVSNRLFGKSQMTYEEKVAHLIKSRGLETLEGALAKQKASAARTPAPETIAPTDERPALH